MDNLYVIYDFRTSDIPSERYQLEIIPLSSRVNIALDGSGDFVDYRVDLITNRPSHILEWISRKASYTSSVEHLAYYRLMAQQMTEYLPEYGADVCSQIDRDIAHELKMQRLKYRRRTNPVG